MRALRVAVWAWRLIGDGVTHGLSLAVRREGVNDLHPGVPVSKISVLWLSSTGANAGASLSGLLLNQGVPTLFQLSPI